MFVRGRLALRGLCAAAAAASLSVVSAPSVSHCEAKRPADPLSCANPVCADKMSVFRMATQQVGTQQRQSSSSSSSSSSASSSSSSSASTAPHTQSVSPSVTHTDPQTDSQAECPLDKNELGRSTWRLLHSLSVYFPESPSAEEQRAAREIVSALALLYPCPHCAEDFRESIQKIPPRVSSRAEFMQWVCEQHNLVNAKLDKPLFSCDVARIDERWRTGRPGCWSFAYSQEDDEFKAVAVEKEEDEE